MQTACAAVSDLQAAKRDSATEGFVPYEVRVVTNLIHISRLQPVVHSTYRSSL